MTQTLDLSKHEIDAEFAVRNAPPASLYEDAVIHEHAAIADSGALIIRSGKKTGRSPLDKRIVDHRTAPAASGGGRSTSSSTSRCS